MRVSNICTSNHPETRGSRTTRGTPRQSHASLGSRNSCPSDTWASRHATDAYEHGAGEDLRVAQASESICAECLCSHCVRCPTGKSQPSRVEAAASGRSILASRITQSNGKDDRNAASCSGPSPEWLVLLQTPTPDQAFGCPPVSLCPEPSLCNLVVGYLSATGRWAASLESHLTTALCHLFLRIVYPLPSFRPVATRIVKPKQRKFNSRSQTHDPLNIKQPCSRIIFNLQRQLCTTGNHQKRRVQSLARQTLADSGL